MKYFIIAIILITKYEVSRSQGLKSNGNVVLGTYDFYSSGGYHRKTYYLGKIFLDNFMGAYDFCKVNDMDLVYFSDAAESKAFLEMCKKNIKLFTLYNASVSNGPSALIGGMIGKSSTDCYWFESNAKINFPLQFIPGHLDLSKNPLATCLGVSSINNTFGYDNFYCLVGNQFVCQEVKPIGRGLIPNAGLPGQNTNKTSAKILVTTKSITSKLTTSTPKPKSGR